MTKTILILVICLAFTAGEANFLNGLLGGCTCSDVQKMIAESEGSRSCVYNDSLGIPTIGIGFNLKRSDAPTLIAGLGLSYDKVLNNQQCLTEAQITSLFNNDLTWAKAGAASCITSFNSQPVCVQNVLIDMTFNMGKSSLCSWPTFNKQLTAKQYTDAASNMSGSQWCGQVKSRCTRDVNIMKSC